MMSDNNETLDRILGKLLAVFETDIDAVLRERSAPAATPVQNTTPSGSYRVTTEELAQLLRTAREDTSTSAQQRVRNVLDRCGAAVARTTSDIVIREYGHAALFVNDESRAALAYARLEHPTNRELAVLGIHALETGRFAEAGRYIARSRDMAPGDAPAERVLAESHLQIRQGMVTPFAHIRILAPVLDTSYEAAVLLGTLHYNAHQNELALGNFRTARKLQRGRPEGHLGVIAATIAAGGDPSVHIHAYREAFRDARDPEVIRSAQTVPSIPIPGYTRSRRLYDIVR